MVCLLIGFHSLFAFSIDVYIESSHQKKYVYFEYEPTECEILEYVKTNISEFFPKISKLDRGLKIIRSLDNSFYVRLSSDNNNYHCNDNGMYICKNCCKVNSLSSNAFQYKFLPPSEYHLSCSRCKRWFINEDDYSIHLMKCAPSLLEKFLN